MLECAAFFEALIADDVTFFAGVPDSLLKDLCGYLHEHAPAEAHVIAANEGSAVALAAGHHLATGRLGAVYIQNSGLGNAVNPLVSLADADVYAIPMLLLIGWRGQPGKNADEPQHVKQGRITLTLLETLEVPHRVLSADPQAALAEIAWAVDTARSASAPSALVIEMGTFAPYPCQESEPNAISNVLKREQAIGLLAQHSLPGALFVSTTGKASRELFEFRASQGAQPGRDFLTVGSMGHASQIALGISLAQPDRSVCCLDGDGAVIMHMGGLATIGSRAPRNFQHVVINNGAHDSVGGQPTAGFEIDIPAIASACGYRGVASVGTANDLIRAVASFTDDSGPHFLEVRVSRGARADLGRPTTSPQENKQEFMCHFA
jgi:phosphonopyruvate decarboxylase